MNLSVRSFNCLKRAGLRTVGDILAYGDLRGIRNLTRKCIEEIREKLWELSKPQSFHEMPEIEETDYELFAIDDYELPQST